MIMRSIVNATLFITSLALTACGPSVATTEGVNIGDPVAPENRPPYQVYDNWDTRTRFRSTYPVYQNVEVDDVRPLLSNSTFVSYFENRKDDSYGQLQVTHWHDDTQYRCYFNDESVVEISYWKPIMHLSTKRLLQWPLLALSRTGDWENPTGYQNLQYNGETGAFARMVIWRGDWWEMSKGHLQHGIPAAVYDICPDFPSADSLGVPLIQDQTATNYFELLEQNPGNRIIRPDLVTDYTPRHWYPQ